MTEGLEIRNCVFGYRDRRREKRIVSASGLCFRPGDFFVLYGRNGAGKSTVLRTLAGLQLPLSGEIFWNGEDWTKLTPARRAQIAAVVLTGFPEMGLFTAFETVALGRAPYTGWRGRLTAADCEAVDAALETVGAVSLRNRVFDSLSDGEKQKIMTARALAQQTPLLLLDEPTAFLDYAAKKDFFRLLSKAASEAGKAVIVSTHDLLYAETEHPRWLLCGNGTVSGIPFCSDVTV